MDTPRCFWAPRSCHLCGAQQQPEHRSVFAHSCNACDWAPKRSNDFMMQCAWSPTEDFDGIPADHSPVKPATQCRLAHKAKHKVKGGRKVASECKQGRAQGANKHAAEPAGQVEQFVADLAAARTQCLAEALCLLPGGAFALRLCRLGKSAQEQTSNTATMRLQAPVCLMVSCRPSPMGWSLFALRGAQALKGA